MLPTITSITTTITARSPPAHHVRSLACPASAPSPLAPSSCGISRATLSRRACSSSRACTAMPLFRGRLNYCSTSELSTHPKQAASCAQSADARSTHTAICASTSTCTLAPDRTSAPTAARVSASPGHLRFTAAFTPERGRTPVLIAGGVSLTWLG